MTDLQSVYERNRSFFVCFAVWFACLSVVVFFFPKNLSFTVVNSMHHPITDYIFTGLTFMGDGICIITIAVVMFLVKRKKIALAFVGSYIFSGLFCMVLKKSFNMSRPAFFLKANSSFHAVEWLPLAFKGAFPSGHATSVFAIVTCITLYSTNKKLSLIAIGIAFLTAYSRVYLGQHYIMDVWAGSLLGVFSSVFLYIIHQRVLSKQGLKFTLAFPSSK